MTKQQKIYVGGGAVVVFLLLLAQFALIPVVEAKKNTRRAIAANKKILSEMIILGADYKAIKQRSDEIEAILARRPKDLTIFSYLEKKAVESGIKNHVKSMNASNVVSTGGVAAGGVATDNPRGPARAFQGIKVEETAVEMNLEKVTLKQLSNFLYNVEGPHELVRIKKISINKMKDSPEYLSAVMQVVMYHGAGNTGR